MAVAASHSSQLRQNHSGSGCAGRRASTPLLGIVYFFMSEEGSDVQKHVIVQEIPDVAVGMVASVQQQVIVQEIPDVAAGLEFCVQEQMIVQEIPDVAVGMDSSAQEQVIV